MYPVYLFRHLCPLLLLEKFQALPFQTEGVTAYFSIIHVGLANKISFAGHCYPTLLLVFSSIKFPHCPCLRPYHLEYTSSRPITEVKQG